jgi:hypothetical protein
MTVAAPPAPTTAPPADSNLVRAASGIGLIVALLTLPVVLLAGGPFTGWVLGVVLWGANWTVQLVTAKYALNLQATAAVGVSGVSFIARAWLVALVLFIVALRFSETVGLTAAAVFLAAFTCDLGGRTILFSIQQKMRKAAEG